MKYSLFRFCSVLCFALVLVACENRNFRSTEKGTLAGGALGAGLGAIVGNQTGSTGAGIAIGSAIGALSGALVGRQMDATDDKLADRERRIQEQQRQIDENRKILNELRAGGLDVTTTERGVVISLPDVLFEFDSARLTPSARATVSEITKVTGKYSDRTIAVEGHTDSIGSIEYNQSLSERRAASVKDELIYEGVPRDRIVSRGFGEVRPVSSNQTPSGRQRNRRVEVIIENR